MDMTIKTTTGIMCSLSVKLTRLVKTVKSPGTSQMVEL